MIVGVCGDSGESFTFAWNDWTTMTQWEMFKSSLLRRQSQVPNKVNGISLNGRLLLLLLILYQSCFIPSRAKFYGKPIFIDLFYFLRPPMNNRWVSSKKVIQFSGQTRSSARRLHLVHCSHLWWLINTLQCFGWLTSACDVLVATGAAFVVVVEIITKDTNKTNSTTSSTLLILWSNIFAYNHFSITCSYNRGGRFWN